MGISQAIRRRRAASRLGWPGLLYFNAWYQCILLTVIQTQQVAASMPIISLGYLSIRSNKLSQWRDFATRFLGLQSIDHTRTTTAFRMDDRKQRLIVANEAGDTLGAIGWEVDSRQELDNFAARLDQLNITVTAGNAALCDQRFVHDLIAFKDPEGNQIELFWQPQTDLNPFIPGRPISGFVTGAFGMGHAVLHVKNAEKLLPFYRDTLGFSVSDYGLTPYPMYFFHVNGRHHSFALIGSGQSGFHHFMVEYQNLDDVGQGYDIAQNQDTKIAYTLGRHTNDYMTSFYTHTPSDFFIESGWGGRVIDPLSWEAEETFDGPSFWGHERLYLPETKRSVLREMRMDAASRGHRSPPLAECPWLYQHYSTRH